jgi:hypothetical protein
MLKRRTRGVESIYPSEKTEEITERGEDESRYLRYPHDRTKLWLSWLAWQMVRHNQIVFYIERLQPDWLPHIGRKRLRGIVGLGFGVLSILLICMGFGAFCDLRRGLILRMICGLSAWTVGGLMIRLAVLLVRGVRGKIDCVERLGWSFARALEVFSEGPQIDILGPSGHPIVIAAFATNLILVCGLILTSVPLCIVLFAVFIMDIPTFLACGITVAGIEKKAAPNQGITLSLKFSTIGGMSLGFAGGVVFGLSASLVYGALAGQVFALFGSLCCGLGGGLLAGGEACFKHVVVRLLLVQKSFAPLDYVRFLDFAARKILLNKVGGGYKFVHLMLRDHFANRFDASEYSDSAAKARPSRIELQA